MVSDDDADDATLPVSTSGSVRPVGVVVRVVGASAQPGEFRLKQGVCKIGSGPGNDLVVSDRTVSRQHVVLSLAPEGVVVRDLDSTNGTFYLGQRVGTIVLSLGARLTLGSVTVVLDADTETLLDELGYEGTSYAGIVGTSPRMRTLFALLQRLRGSLATVLIEGESGTGKERVARVIHDQSRVARGPFVVINCGAIARELVASELFGHKKGAFSGALDARRGAFESADGGTLVLDEVGELPLDIQPALLRAIESGEVRPVGSDATRHVKVRLVASTNRDLGVEVDAGRFRQDLFYRLAVVRLQTPALRGRPEDIELLARHFASELGLPLAPAMLEQLKAQRWPGNVRELRNALQSLAAVGQLPGTRPPPSPFESVLEEVIDPTLPYAEQKERLVEQFTRLYLQSLLRFANGNQSAAARVSQIERTYLGRLLAKHGLAGRKPGS